MKKVLHLWMLVLASLVLSAHESTELGSEFNLCEAVFNPKGLMASNLNVDVEMRIEESHPTPHALIDLSSINCATQDLFAADTLSACGSSYTLDAGAGFSSYLWSNGATTSSITVSASGTYSCTVTDNNGCSSTDQVYVEIQNLTDIAASETTICQGDTLHLIAQDVFTQLGQDIDGEAAYDYSGHSVSLSADGQTVAIGAYYNDGNGIGSDAGHVRVYSFNGSSWSQLGQDIDGEAAGDRSGWSVSLSADGQTVAIGAYQNDGNGNNAGHVRVYSFNGSSWSQLGQDIDGEAAGDYSGWSVSLSADGQTVAIGANYNDGNGIDAGHVRVYSFNGSSWSQLGQDIDGEAADDRSSIVSLSADGQTVAIGAGGNDGNGLTSGHVRVYSFNGSSWSQLGQDIDGEAAGDQSGYSVSLSADGQTVAIGAPYHDENNAGHVRVYSFNGSSWSQLGQDIDGEAAGDLSSHVSLSADGQTVAIGATRNYGNGLSAGHVRVYSFNGSSWSQLGQDIDGEAAGDESGYSVSLSADGQTVAIGAARNGGNGINAGHVRVYNLPTSQNGNTYSWSTGDTTATISVVPAQTTTYYCTVSNGNATCTDSVTITVNPLPVFDLGPDTLRACGNRPILDAGAGFSSYLWSTGATTPAITVGPSGTYSCTVTDNNGCSSTDHVYVAVQNLFDIAASETTICLGGNLNLMVQDGFAQLGQDIRGEAAGDQSGYSVSLSADGQTVAIGAPRNEVGGTGNWDFSGHVRIYTFTGSGWTQVGQDIDGKFSLSETGYSVSLSADGQTVAIGAPGEAFAGNGGQVSIYSFNGSNWSQVGQDIDGEAAGDESGTSVSLSADGQTVAIGAPYNDGNGSYAGHVRIYSFNGSSWSQVGQDIDGEAAGDRSGRSVSLSADGQTVAIGAPYNDGNGSEAGHVRIYSFNGSSWSQVGQDIDGEAAVDWLGASVSLSADGQTVAIGAPRNDDNGVEAGQVRVYNFNGTAWSQVGQDIDGEATGDWSGQSVSLSADGQTVAIGVGGNAHSRIYTFNTSSWFQVGQDIDKGSSVSLSADGQTVAIGSPGANRVRIYSLPDSMSSKTYLWSTGDSTANLSVAPTQTTTYYCTVSEGSATCTDSITITVNPLPVFDLGPDTLSACGSSYILDAGAGFSSYLWSNGVTTSSITVNTSGTYSCTVTDSNGCSSTDQVYVALLNLFEIAASGETTVCQEDTLNLMVQDVFAQLGQYIDGEAEIDWSGSSVSLSANGQTVAIGATDNNGNGVDAGHVRVYNFNGTNWSQLGQDIDGEAAFDNSGMSVSLSADGQTVAIGAPYNDGNGSDAGHVRIYTFNGSSWSQLGQDIDGEAAGDESGASVSLSADGQTVAIGAPSWNIGNGNGTGHVRIYTFNGSSWSQVGQDIDGEAAGDWSGYSVSLSADGQTVAIGAVGNAGNGSYAGHVRIYTFNGSSWSQVGQDIDGEAAEDFSGASVALSSDGQTVAIGAPYNAGNGSNAGHVRIYTFNGTAWTQVGQDIDGEAAGDASGDVSLSADGQTVAIGAVGNDGNGSDAGHVRIYTFNGTAWSQVGQDIDGEAADDRLGASVSLSADGQTVAIGAPLNDGNGSSAGHVRIYSLPASGSSKTYLWSTGDTTAAISVVPTQTTTYYCTVSNGNATCTDSVTITVNQIPSIDLGPDTVGARNGSYTLDAGSASGDYRWSTGETTPSITVTTSGLYWVEVGTAPCVSADTVYVNFIELQLQADTTQLCKGDSTSISLVQFVNTTQLGFDINGQNSYDRAGSSVSLSSSGTRVAIGAPFNDDAGANAGHVGVYQWSEANNTWYPLTLPVRGMAAGDNFGYCVSLSSDGSRMAVGAPGHDGTNGNDAGHTRIFEWTGSTWIQLGSAIPGEFANDKSGTSVSLSRDGNHVAIGAPLNDSTGLNAGQVRIFEWDGSNWLQLGGEINGEAAEDEFGWSVSLSADGSRVAIGARFNDGSGSNAGHTRVFDWDGTNWTQTGSDIDGENGNDNSGSSVSLSANGRRLGIGAPKNSGNGSNSGHSRVFEWDGTSWLKLGNDIDGKLVGDESGTSISLSADGQRLAIGARFNDENGNNAGQTRIFEWKNGGWSQVGTDINGEFADDFSGYSVSLSTDGKQVAIGAYLNDGGGTTSGHTRVFSLPRNLSLLTYQWSNGDTTSSIVVAPTQTTLYYCTVSDGITSRSDSISIAVNPGPNIDLGPDTLSVCGSSYTLDAGSGFSSYLWNTGDTTTTLTVTSSGLYTVEVDNGTCSARDTVLVNLINLQLGLDEVIDTNFTTLGCGADTLQIMASSSSQLGMSYLWSTGDTTAAITVVPTQTTTYYCTVSDGISSCTDSLTIQTAGGTPQANVVGNYQVNISWNSTGAGAYKLFLRKTGSPTWTTYISSNTSRVFQNREPGNYEFYVEDISGDNASCLGTFTIDCANDIDYSYNVFQAPELGRKGRVRVFNTQGGQRLYDIHLVDQIGDSTSAFNSRQAVFRDLTDGFYVIFVRDNFGCMADSIGVFMINPLDTVFIPNLINAPNNPPNGFRPTWNAVGGVLNYQLRVLNITDGTLQDFVTGITDTSYAVTNLPAGKLYRFNVRSRYNDGTGLVNSGYSNAVSRNLPVGGNKGEQSGDEGTSAGTTVDVTVYPNPTKGILYVQAPAGSALTLIDLNGKAIARRTATGVEEIIDMTELAQGVYLLEVNSQGQLFRERIVKQ